MLLMPEGTHLMEGNLSSTEICKRMQIGHRLELGVDLIEGLVASGVLSCIHRNNKQLYLPKEQDASPIGLRQSFSKKEDKVVNVAVFGGAFDPPTTSHMFMLAEIIHSGRANEALLLPCGPRPDKPDLRPPLTR